MHLVEGSKHVEQLIVNTFVNVYVCRDSTLESVKSISTSLSLHNSSVSSPVQPFRSSFSRLGHWMMACSSQSPQCLQLSSCLTCRLSCNAMQHANAADVLLFSRITAMFSSIAHHVRREQSHSTHIFCAVSCIHANS